MAMVQRAWDRAVCDLGSLFLLEGSGPERYTPAAGLPEYQALFGRDSLMTACQCGLLGPDMLRGTLLTLRRWNATAYDDRYDEQPGKIVHQHQRSPLALLGKTPFRHYYGDYTAPALFLIGLASDFAWTGDAGLIRSTDEEITRTLTWMDRDGDLDGDGLYEYQTRAGNWGIKNQGWKDSAQAILYPDGRTVPDPIALIEIQGAYYAAKRLMGLAYRAISEAARGTALLEQAAALKRRVNERFWLPDEQYVALALDPDKKPVRTIACDPGQALIYGVLDRDKAQAVARRLLAPDLFSGWGVRTLSSGHPAYNPLSYHLGSVWPLANAMIAAGLKLYGFIPELHALAKGLFEATGLFDLGRLPETFGGHPRDASTPIPASIRRRVPRRPGRPARLFR